MKAIPIDIHWHEHLPIFASEPFLKAVGNEYGWLAGVDDLDSVRCILPYTIIQKPMLRMVRFRLETLPFAELDIANEIQFLNNVVDFFRSKHADVIIPASNNAIFRTFPDGAQAAPYGSYVLDLTQSEEQLWRNIKSKVRQNINGARKNGIFIREDDTQLDSTYSLIRETFKRSRLPFMNYKSFERLIHGLNGHCKVMIAEYQGVPQSYVVFAYSTWCTFAIYGGNIAGQQQGAIKLLCWEAIRTFKQLGVERFDFFGSRVYPEQGSKQAQLSDFKRRFGAQLKTGFMWKYALNPNKYWLYTLARRLRTGGDIVDAERHKLGQFMLETSAGSLQSNPMIS